jgi:hypothetical protein
MAIARTAIVPAVKAISHMELARAVSVTGRPRTVPVVRVTGRTAIVPAVRVTGRMAIVPAAKRTGRTRIGLVVKMIGPTATVLGTRATDQVNGARRRTGRGAMSVPTRTDHDGMVTGPTATTPEEPGSAVRDDRPTPTVLDATRVGRTRPGRRAMATAPTRTGPAVIGRTATSPTRIGRTATSPTRIGLTAIGPARIGPARIGAVPSATAAKSDRRIPTAAQLTGRIARDPVHMAIGPTASARVTRMSVHPAGIGRGPMVVEHQSARTATDQEPPHLGHSNRKHRSATSGRVATTARRAVTTAHRVATIKRRAVTTGPPAPARSAAT